MHKLSLSWIYILRDFYCISIFFLFKSCLSSMSKTQDIHLYIPWNVTIVTSILTITTAICLIQRTGTSGVHSQNYFGHDHQYVLTHPELRNWFVKVRLKTVIPKNYFEHDHQYDFVIYKSYISLTYICKFIYHILLVYLIY